MPHIYPPPKEIIIFLSFYGKLVNKKVENKLLSLLLKLLIILNPPLQNWGERAQILCIFRAVSRVEIQVHVENEVYFQPNDFLTRFLF